MRTSFFKMRYLVTEKAHKQTSWTYTALLSWKVVEMRPINGLCALICQNARSRNICACPRPLLEKYFLNLTNNQQVMFLERKQSQPQRTKATGSVFWPTRPSSLSNCYSSGGNDDPGKETQENNRNSNLPSPWWSGFPLRNKEDRKSRLHRAPPTPEGAAPRCTPSEGRSRKWARCGSPSRYLAGSSPVFLLPVHHTDPVRPGCDVRRSILTLQPSWPQG